LGESSKATSNVNFTAVVLHDVSSGHFYYFSFVIWSLFFKLDAILEYPSPESICDVTHAPPRWEGDGGVARPLSGIRARVLSNAVSPRNSF
jgi:hypothetical protein